MKLHQDRQAIKQLEKRKGGYYYMKLDAKIVDTFSRKKATRLICTINKIISYRCGLNHLGDGNFFIIIAGKYLKKLNKDLGDYVDFIIKEDPDQLGVAVPEILPVFLEQDEAAKETYDKLTDGKKRSLIYSFNKIKNIDRQIEIITTFLIKEKAKMK